MTEPTPAAIVVRCEEVMSHVWMVRTFVKHSEEAEEFPELMQTARICFDTARALETRLDDPAKYLHMLRKKLSKLARAADAFRDDAPQASSHMNFQQAVKSLDAAVAELRRLLTAGDAAVKQQQAAALSHASGEEE